MLPRCSLPTSFLGMQYQSLDEGECNLSWAEGKPGTVSPTRADQNSRTGLVYEVSNRT